MGERARHFVALRQIVQALHEGTLKAPADVAHRLLRIHRDALRMDDPETGLPDAPPFGMLSRSAGGVARDSAFRLAWNQVRPSGRTTMGPAGFGHQAANGSAFQEALAEVRAEFAQATAHDAEESHP